MGNSAGQRQWGVRTRVWKDPEVLQRQKKLNKLTLSLAASIAWGPYRSPEARTKSHQCEGSANQCSSAKVRRSNPCSPTFLLHVLLNSVLLILPSVFDAIALK